MVSNENKPPLSYDYICQNCNKTYKDNSGLWKHKKNIYQKNILRQFFQQVTLK